MDDPFDNLIYAETDKNKLLLHESKPILGDGAYLDQFSVDEENYTTFKIGKREKFVIGDYKEHTNYISSCLD